MEQMKCSLVSILVPSYNAGPYLGELVKSILAQTCTNWELLILDDGGSDLQYPGVRELLSDARIRCYQWNPNRGVSEATRFLMQQVKGDFWCYPGADDVLRPEFVSQRVKVMMEHPEVALVFGQGGQIDEQGKEIWFQTGREAFQMMEALHGVVLSGEEMLLNLLEGNPVSTPSIMGRSASTLPHLLRYHYNWRFCQDWFYWLLLAGSGCRFLYDHTVLHDYRYHSNQLTRRNDLLPVRIVEPSLVLLMGLHLASRDSDLATLAWWRFRIPLYANFLLRSFKRRDDTYDNLWRVIGRQAWETTSNHGLFGILESLKLGWWMFRLGIEIMAEKRRGRVLYGLPHWLVGALVSPANLGASALKGQKT